MALIRDCPIRRFGPDGAVSAADKVVTEARIELDVNDGQLRLAMLALPTELEALAVGFLLGEGALRAVADLERVEARESEGKVFVRGDLDADVLEAMGRRWTWGSGCGGGGTSRDMDSSAYRRVGPGPRVASRRLAELVGEFQRAGELWRQTGGVHACALAGNAGIIRLAEDVGRHNAFDKVVGAAALAGVDVSDKFVLATGRLSAEIVSKAVACRVPMLVSRSAVTSLAVELGRRFGLTLVGFVRGRRMNVYTGYERIVSAAGEGEK